MVSVDVLAPTGVAATLLVVLWRMPKVRTLLQLIVHVVAVVVLVRLDRLFGLSRYMCAFPRSPAELLRRPPRRFLRELCDQIGRLRSRTRHDGATDVDLRAAVNLVPGTSSGAAVLEPDKAASRAAIRETSSSTDLFVKTGDPDARGLPVWLSALASFKLNREILFYARVRHLLPTAQNGAFDAPELICARESALLLRWCLIVTNKAPHGVVEWQDEADEAKEVVAVKRRGRRDSAAASPQPRRRASRSPVRVGERVHDLPTPPPAFVVPDRRGCSYAQAAAVMRGLATVHARFWACPHLHSELGFLNEPREGRSAGYVAAPAVRMLVGRALKKLPKLAQLWAVLHARLADAPVTVLHGDCRPENLLFHDEGDKVWRVTFLDWEAVGVNPAANDLAYFLVVGLRSSCREAWWPALLKEYHQSLQARGAQSDAAAPPLPEAAARSIRELSYEAVCDQVRLLGCVMLVVQACFAVTEVFKGWGNNKKNMLPWLVRLCRYTTRLEVPRLVEMLQPHAGSADVEGILRGMMERAEEGLAKLRREHGASTVDSM